MLHLTRSWLLPYAVGVLSVTLALLLTLRHSSIAEIPLLLFFAVGIFSAWYSGVSRKQQSDLQQRQEELKAIVDNSPVLVYLKDTQGRFLLVNRQLESLFHVTTRDEVIGKTDYEILPKEIADKFTANDREVLEALKPLEFEEIAPHNDGLHTYISIKFPLYNSHGVAYAVCGISTDITKRRQAEEALKQVRDELELRVEERTAELVKANAELKQLLGERERAEEALLLSDEILKQLPDAILITDLEGKIQKWLGKASDIFGYTASEAIGKPVKFIHRPDIKQITTARIIKEIQETGEFFGEIPCLRKNGAEVPIETTAKIFYDKTGKPLLLVGINRDISERKISEKDRAQLIREQTLRAAAEAAQYRSDFLAEVSEVLASSLDYNTTQGECGATGSTLPC